MFIKRRGLSFIIFIIGLLSLSFSAYAEGSIREYRTHLLENLRKEAKILNKGKICKTKHFAVYIDNQSLKDFYIEKGKRLENLMLRICFVFEEAYQVIGENFDRYPSGKFEVTVYSEKEYERITGEGYNLSVGRSKLRIPFSRKEFGEPLGDFLSGIEKIYYAYTRVFLYTITGPDFYNRASTEIGKYFQRIGKETSSWLKDISEDERVKIINLIDEEYKFLFKKYPQYFKNKIIERKYIKCKWCGKEVDVTGKRKGERILCPYCHNPIFVE